jgi:hypothetical protein
MTAIVRLVVFEESTMRKVLLTLAILLLVTSQVARADVSSGPAPADEYFGPYKQSVIEIRNRLNDYDALDPRAMLDPSVGGYLDHVQVAVRDWQQKYPRDPWLPRIWAHLIREYWRAGQCSSRPGMAALSMMRTTFPDSPETSATISLVYGSNRALDNIAQDRPRVQAYVPYDQPAYQQPAYQQPAYQQSAYQQPEYQPVYQEPAYSQQAYQPPAPAYQEPATPQYPSYQEPAPTYDDGSHDTASVQESIPAQVAAGDQSSGDSPDDAPTPSPMR